ncbi:MAG TPA: chorismate mutase [Candidatus Krumholzibacteria bacterium]|nr:chorismate mutase [Candidatus Krumholzibacteria bacterium]
MPAPRHNRAFGPLSETQRRSLRRQRAQMDRLNARLLAVLQRRAQLAVTIARWKHARGLAVPDSRREAEMMRAWMTRPGSGFAPAALRRILRTILDESRRLVVRSAAANAPSRKRAPRRPPHN